MAHIAVVGRGPEEGRLSNNSALYILRVRISDSPSDTEISGVFCLPGSSTKDEMKYILRDCQVVCELYGYIIMTDRRCSSKNEVIAYLLEMKTNLFVHLLQVVVLNHS